MHSLVQILHYYMTQVEVKRPCDNTTKKYNKRKPKYYPSLGAI